MFLERRETCRCSNAWRSRHHCHVTLRSGEIVLAAGPCFLLIHLNFNFTVPITSGMERTITVPSLNNMLSSLPLPLPVPPLASPSIIHTYPQLPHHPPQSNPDNPSLKTQNDILHFDSTRAHNIIKRSRDRKNADRNKKKTPNARPKNAYASPFRILALTKASPQKFRILQSPK